jgi:hypothetical protein
LDDPASTRKAARALLHAKFLLQQTLGPAMSKPNSVRRENGHELPHVAARFLSPYKNSDALFTSE